MLLDGNVTGAIDWKKAPIPQGRTMIACQRMFQRTKEAVKEDIERLKSGMSVPEAGENGEHAEKATKAKTSRKKKVVVDGAEDQEGGDAQQKSPKARAPRKKKATEGEAPKSPTKRGRPPKKIEEGDEIEEAPIKKIKLEEDDIMENDTESRLAHDG